jgi:cell division protein FtsL
LGTSVPKAKNQPKQGKSEKMDGSEKLPGDISFKKLEKALYIILFIIFALLKNRPSKN